MKILNITFGNKYFYSDPIFFPIAAGGGRSDIQCDDEGDNISSKNNKFGELTAVYWAWKNLKNVDIIGMSHYRRYLMPESRLLKLFPYTKTFYNLTWSRFLSFKYHSGKFRRYLVDDNYDFVFAKRWHFEGVSVESQFLQHHSRHTKKTSSRSC